MILVGGSGICILSALAAAGNTQPTHNLPHHNAEQTQYHTRPEHQMSPQVHHMSQQEHHMSQQEHHMSQPQHHIISQPEPNIRQTHHYINQPQHNFDSWSNVETQAQAQSQTWRSPEQLHYQPREILSPPHHISQPDIIHSQPQPIDPQFEFHPYPYQHPHYPPTGSHHTQDAGPVYPTHGWNTQNPGVVHQQQPEAPVPESYFNSNREDYPNQSSAVASAVSTSISNSVPDTNHEPAYPQLYKIMSIPKADEGAVYTMPVANHETRQPNVIHTSNDEGLTDIVQEILAKYRHKPIEIKPKSDNNDLSKKQKSESLDPVHRNHKHKKHKVPTIPVVTKQSSKDKAVAVAKTGTEKTYTIITGGKHNTATKAPLKHKHSHKKVLKPLLDPELLAKELELLSKKLWAPTPAKTHNKDIPCDDNPIITEDCKNSFDADKNDGSNSLDKTNPKDKPKDKYHDKKPLDISPAMTTEKDISEKTANPSSYIEPYHKKDADEDTGCDSANLGETIKPCDGDNPLEEEDKRNKYEPKQIINEKENINLNHVDPKIDNNDFKQKKFVQEKEVIQELTQKVEANKEGKMESLKTKEDEGKQNQKKNEKDADENTDCDSASLDETTEPGDHDNPLEKEDKREKHELKPVTNEKQNINGKFVNPKIENKDFKEEKVVEKQDLKREPTKKVKAQSKENLHQPETNKYKGKQNQINDQNPDKTLEPCDDDNAPEEENDRKKHDPLPKIHDKQNYNPDQNKPRNKPTTHHHIKHAKPHTPTIIVPEKDKTKSTTPSTNVKRGDAADSDETAELRDTVNTKKDEIKKHPSKPKIDGTKNTASKPVDNNRNKDTITDHKVVKKSDYKDEEIKKVEKRKEENTKQPETKKYEGKLNQKKEADEDTDCDSASLDETTEPGDHDNPLEKEDKRGKHEPKPVIDEKQNINGKLVNPKIENKDFKEEKVVEKQELKNEPTKKGKAKSEEKIQQPETNKYKGKQNQIKDQNPDKTLESFDDDNAPEEENDRKKHDPLPKIHDKQNYNPDQNKPRNKPTKHHHIKHAKPHTPTIIVPEKDKTKSTTPSTNVKRGDAADSDETAELRDTVNTKKDEIKKHPSKPKIDGTKNTASKPVDNNRNKDTITDHKVVKKSDYKDEEIKKVEKREEENTKQPETKKYEGKLNQKKDADEDTDCDSASLDETTEPGDHDNPLEKEDKRGKHEPKPVINEKQNINGKLVNPKIENKDFKEEKVVEKQELKNEPTKKGKAKSEEKIQQPETNKYKGKQNQIKDQNPDKTLESFDDDNAPEEENDRKKHDPLPKIHDKQNYNPDQNKPRNKPTTHHHIKHAKPHTPTIIVPEKDKTKSTTPSTNVKRGDAADSDETAELRDTVNTKKDEIKKHPSKPKIDDTKNTASKPVDNNRNKDTITDHQVVKKSDYKDEEIKKVEKREEDNTKQPETKKYEGKLNQKKDADEDTDCDSADSDETTELRDTVNTPEKKGEFKNYLPKPKTDNTKNSAAIPVGNNGKIDTRTDHKDDQKMDVKKITKEQELVHQSEKTTQHPETYGEKEKPIEQGNNAPVSDDCDSSEGSVNQETYDKISDPEHKKEVIKLLPKTIKDDYKPVSLHTHKINKHEIIFSKKDAKKEQQTKVTQKVNTKNEDQIYQIMKNEPKPHKYEDELKPKKQGKRSSDIEDNEPEPPLDKTSAPEYKIDLKEPLPQANQDNKASKDPINEKKIVDKIEETLKVEKKTKKSTKNVVSSEADDKSKPVEKSNENSDIDDCDSADSETDPKLNKTKTIKEKHDAKKKKTEEVIKKKVTIAKNNAEGKATSEELTSDVVADILEKTETDQPLSTVGFLISLISHALRGDSVRQMFEEPKIKKFVKGFIVS